MIWPKGRKPPPRQHKRWPDRPGTYYDQIRDYADGTRTYADLMEITGRSYKSVTRAFRTVRDRGFPVAVKLDYKDNSHLFSREDYILFRDRFNEGWTPQQIANYKGEGWTASKVEWYWENLRVMKAVEVQNAMLEDYLAGEKTEYLAAKYGVNRRYFRKLARRNGKATRPNGRPKKSGQLKFKFEAR